MKHRRFLILASAALCLAVSISAYWLWQTLSAPKYEACARLAAGNDPAAGADTDKPNSVDEGQIFSPEVLSAAAILIADRNVPLSLASPFDSVTGYLLERTRVARPDRGGPEEILITCSAANADEALQMLAAVVDAYLDPTTVARAVHADSAIDDSQSVELQTEFDQLARAIDEKQQGIAELAAQLDPASATAVGSAGNDPITLEAALGEARRASSDAAARLNAARQDFEKKLPGEIIAARITDVPVRTKVLERLNQAKIKNDLEQQEALRQKWSAIYGRNHPRMAEIRQHIESLEQQVSLFANGGHDQPPDALPASGASIVLAALESESAGLNSAARELETRLSAAQQGVQRQQELESRLSESRQELEFLHAEHGRLWKQIDGARRNQTGRLAALIDPPALSPNSIAPQAGLQMAAACVSGMALFLLVIWQLRLRSAGARATAAPRSNTDASVRRDRFRSHEEEQLMRLKLQSAR